MKQIKKLKVNLPHKLPQTKQAKQNLSELKQFLQKKYSRYT